MSLKPPPPPGSTGKLSNVKRSEEFSGENTGRFKRIVHEENDALQTSLALSLSNVVRRWAAIVIIVGGAVWTAAGYLGGKASAGDVQEVKDVVEAHGNRITALEQIPEAMKRMEAQQSLVISQLYQLALRTGATVISSPPVEAMPSPPLAPHRSALPSPLR